MLLGVGMIEGVSSMGCCVLDAWYRVCCGVLCVGAGWEVSGVEWEMWGVDCSVWGAWCVMCRKRLEAKGDGGCVEYEPENNYKKLNK